MKQRSLLREVSIDGPALHTGNASRLTLKPAPENHGVVIRRVDLHEKPEFTPHISQVGDLVRNTTLKSGHAQIHTVENVMAALHGMGIDNVVIEMDASEPPIMDGSARAYVNMILEGEPVEQEAEREVFSLDKPISVSQGNSSLIALPYDGFKVTCTSADDRGIHTQHLSLDIDPEVFSTQIAAARTFTVFEDIEELIKIGKIKGGSLENAIVLKGDKILSKEPLRFEDELVRHKILDVIGDIFLLGKPLKAHIIAVRPGHALNSELTKKLYERMDELEKGHAKKATESRKIVVETETELDIRRVIEFRGDDELTAVKNCTINEEYFQGHYPGQPIMPGVLQIEAMAQAAGILMLRVTKNEGMTAVFMSIDKVKFRNKVIPGDQLKIDVKLTKIMRGKIGTAEATCSVGDKVASSGELKFMLVDKEAEV